MIYYSPIMYLMKIIDSNKLTDIEKYIKKNNHLPDVPSAQEVTENGMKLAEMTNILLRKIEELTLYVINQNKQIQSLQDEVAQLKKKRSEN